MTLVIVFVQFFNVREVVDEETLTCGIMFLLNTHLKLIPDPSSAFTVRQVDVVHCRVLECI